MAFVNKIFATFMVVIVIFNLINLSVSQECAELGMSCEFLPCCDPSISGCNIETKVCQPGILDGGEGGCAGLGEQCNVTPCCNPGELTCDGESVTCQPV